MKRRGKLQNRMLYETHARMRFDMSEGSDAYREGWDRIFGKKDPGESINDRIARTGGVPELAKKEFPVSDLSYPVTGVPEWLPKDSEEDRWQEFERRTKDKAKG